MRKFRAGQHNEIRYQQLNMPLAILGIIFHLIGSPIFWSEVLDPSIQRHWAGGMSRRRLIVLSPPAIWGRSRQKRSRFTSPTKTEEEVLPLFCEHFRPLFFFSKILVNDLRLLLGRRTYKCVSTVNIIMRFKGP